MPELTVEQRDALQQQNAANIKRQADFMEAQVAEWKKFVAAMEAKTLMSPEQDAFAGLFATCLETRKTAMSTTVSDAVLVDVAKDALLMAHAVWADYKVTMGF